MNLVERLARPEIQALQAYRSARSLAADHGILLNANENPWPPLADEGQCLNRYPEPQPAALLAALARVYDLPGSQLLLTRGSDEAIDLLLRAFCQAGSDAIAICPPCFGMYEIAARIQGAAVLRYPLHEDQRFDIDFAALATAPAKLIFLCNPNNPTGHTLPREGVLALARETAERALIVVDEAYVEFSTQPSLCDALDEHPNLVVLRTLSKAWALAGARLGILAAQTGIVQLLRKILAPYPLPKPAISAALTALAPEHYERLQQQVKSIVSERERLRQALSQHPQVRQIYPSDANFLLIQVRNAAALVGAAASAGILLRDQSAQPGLANCVRISVGDRTENDALLNFMARWQ